MGQPPAGTAARPRPQPSTAPPAAAKTRPCLGRAAGHP